MPNATRAELQRLRTWRTWLLITVAFVQGAQYLIHPELALASHSYTVLHALGRHGWMVFGLLLMGNASYLAAVPKRWQWAGHFIGAVLYLTLSLASALSGVVPAVLALPALLHLGEVRLRAWHQREDR